eukprot:1983344-Amphidinium_carterae.1
MGYGGYSSFKSSLACQLVVRSRKILKTEPQEDFSERCCWRQTNSMGQFGSEGEVSPICSVVRMQESTGTKFMWIDSAPNPPILCVRDSGELFVMLVLTVHNYIPYVPTWAFVILRRVMRDSVGRSYDVNKWCQLLGVPVQELGDDLNDEQEEPLHLVGPKHLK